ncbi:hypothetical protein GGR58DRAFT_515688 [Xylaria digitata]|nr:hypothetical protein GGR58DRAFT_515688 [Xylaria digitata]
MKILMRQYDNTTAYSLMSHDAEQEDPPQPTIQSWRIGLSKRNKALLLQIALVAATLTTNLILVLYASLKYPSRDGVGLIYTGNCDTTQTSNRYINLLINVLSTGMLSAFNFCIQLQASPTRADVDRIHEHNSWLYIGVLSIRNLKYISRWHLISCIILALSSLPIHLIFNAAVFQSPGSNDYTIAVNLSTAERNRQGDPAWDNYKANPRQNYQRIIADIQSNVTHVLYDAKNASACYALYDDYWAVQGNAVVFVKNETAQQNKNDSLLLYVSFVAFSPPPSVTTWFLGPPRYEVSRCLIQVQPPKATANRCRLLYSAHILKTDERRREALRGEGDTRPTESITAPREATLVTLGDAVASFMRKADKATKNMCLVTKHDIINENIRWMSVVTRKQWSCLILLYTIFLTALYAVLGGSCASLRHRLRSNTVSLSFLHSLGFGLLVNVLIINSPQLIFSILYSLYGTVLTTFLVQREFSLMYSRRKTLRVSEPVGIQRSSYFISLPLRYGIPLNVSSALLHWLLSQSFFIPRITALKPDGAEDYENTFTTLGHSPFAVIVTGIAVFISVIIIILLGCRKYDGTMRVVSTNSKAISAACHSLAEDREFGYQLPVQWGVVEVGEDGIGHCAFTTAPCHVVRKPQEGMLYQ